MIFDWSKRAVSWSRNINCSVSFGGTRFPAAPNGPVGFTESWNGTNWTEVGDLTSVRNALGGAGDSNTAALAFGGEGTGSPNTNKTELWNGSSWTAVNTLNTGRRGEAGFGLGTSTATLAVGGKAGGSALAINEIWNGTNWTEADQSHHEV